MGLRDRVYPRLSAPPVAEATDIWIVEVESGRVVFRASPSARFYYPLRIVHGAAGSRCS
jgi:acyl-coenzyme A thioesterase PaaI-like protein